MIDAPDVRLDLRHHSGSHRKRTAKATFPFNLDGKVRRNDYRGYMGRIFVRPMSQGAGGRITLARARAFYADLR